MLYPSNMAGFLLEFADVRPHEATDGDAEAIMDDDQVMLTQLCDQATILCSASFGKLTDSKSS